MTHQPIRFTKMHGLGNDFMVINNLDKQLNTLQLPITQWGNRHTGIGFDQLLLIEPSTQADFFCRIFNADGSEAEQCGNGLRCIARFLHEEKLAPAATFSIETKAGTFPITVKDYDHITVLMGAPRIEEKLVQLTGTDTGPVTIISMGNPHAIVKVTSTETIAVPTTGAAIAAQFPQGANVGFMQVINPNHIRLRTFERGVGETHACGSNACAAAIAGLANDWLANQVKVEFRYGSLWIEADGLQGPIQMTGPATRIFSGQVSA